jgi:hypothetical protein
MDECVVDGNKRDGECSIRGFGSSGNNESEKSTVWLGCHLVFTPLAIDDTALMIDHPHNPGISTALCSHKYDY